MADGADVAVPKTRRWLTAVVRPAGSLDERGLDQVRLALAILASCGDMVVVDLAAATVCSPGALARVLLGPARDLDQAGRRLLLRGAPRQLLSELARVGSPAVILAD
jgi:hypothetical protein